MQSRNLANGSLKIKDGAGTPKVLVIPIDEGDLEWDESTPTNYVHNRDVLDHQSKGEEVEVTLSFTMKYTEFLSASGAALSTSNSTCSPMDFLDGTFAGLTSVSGRSDVFTTTVEFTVANPETSGSQNEVLTFSNFHLDAAPFKEGQAYNTIRVSGRALITKPTGVRS